MGKQLTLIEALDLSIELWIWLAKTGKEKEEWPSWGEFPRENVAYDCFLCEYTNQRNGNLHDCQGCPLFFLVKMIAVLSILMRNGMWQ